MQPCYGTRPGLVTTDRARRGRCDIKHGGTSYSGVTGVVPELGRPRQEGMLRTGSNEMLCWRGGGGQSEQFVAFPFSSLSPLLTSLRPHTSCIPDGHSHTFLLLSPLVQTALCAPCSEQWKQTCPAAQTETESQDCQEERKSWHLWPAPPDTLSC